MSGKDGTSVRRPDVVAAELALGLLLGPEVGSVPLEAAWWIVEGHDEPEVAALAGLTGDDNFEVGDALLAALAAMGVEIPTTSMAVEILFRDLARRCLDGDITERSLAAKAWRIYVASDYADETTQQPLGTVACFDDEWGAGWGRTDAELATETRSACHAQLRQPEA